MHRMAFRACLRGEGVGGGEFEPRGLDEEEKEEEERSDFPFVRKCGEGEEKGHAHFEEEEETFFSKNPEIFPPPPLPPPEQMRNCSHPRHSFSPEPEALLNFKLQHKRGRSDEEGAMKKSATLLRPPLPSLFFPFGVVGAVVRIV